MASEQILAVRRVQAVEDQAKELNKLNRQIALIIDALKIVDPESVVVSDSPLEPEAAEAQEVEVSARRNRKDK